MRNIVGTGGITASVYLNLDDSDDPMHQQVVINGSGISGLDPNYITLVNDVFTHHKDTTVGDLTANSAGVGSYHVFWEYNGRLRCNNN